MAEPVLKQPELDKPFELEVDVSGFAVGAVLLQRGEDNKRHPIGYYSATLKEAECNYDIYDLELLAIVKALRNWRPFLAGSPHIITVHTDHMNLQYWRQPHKISRCITREVAELAKYNVILQHIPCRELTVDDSNSLLWIDRVYSDSGERGTKAR